MKYILLILLLCRTLGAQELDHIVKKEFTVANFKTFGGITIKELRLGYETYGTLNKNHDNAIFVAHHFTGSSHEAGRYEGESQAGEWDYLIGPNKTIDTNKYFVISSDTICNMNTNTRVVTTGPRSINPETGKPYGMTFPIVTIGDFVHAQHALSVELGIKKFVAVMGASMGSMQAVEWAAEFPEMVERVIAVVPAGLSAAPHLIETLNSWMAAARSPSGLAEAFKLLILETRNYSWATQLFAKDGLSVWTDGNPVLSWDNSFKVETEIDKMSRALAANTDADSFLYTARAIQLFQMGQMKNLKEAIQKTRARFLFMPARSDILLFPKYAEDAVRELKAAGKQASLVYIEGDGGHVEGIVHVDKVKKQIHEFIER